jgi:hypothetical protein
LHHKPPLFEFRCFRLAGLGAFWRADQDAEPGRFPGFLLIQIKRLAQDNAWASFTNLDYLESAELRKTTLCKASAADLRNSWLAL